MDYIVTLPEVVPQFRSLIPAAMASEGESRPTNTANKKKRRAQYLPYNKPPKKGYHAAVRPGVQGIFITCDGGREWQAKTEAINLLDKFYEELLQTKGPDTDAQSKEQAPTVRPARAVSRISDDGSSSSGNESGQDSGDANVQNGKGEGEREGEGGSAMKKRRLETDQENDNDAKSDEVQETRGSTIDKLLEAEIEELGDREKVRFAGLDSGCNGVIFIRMRKEDACPSPPELVEYIMNNAASTRKHMSRFILRLLPVELTCYASAEEIARAAKPLIEQHFPSGEGQLPIKFAVLYEARANSGIERSKIIDTVAKLVPQPHKVDLSNPDQTIIVQIVKPWSCNWSWGVTCKIVDEVLTWKAITGATTESWKVVDKAVDREHHSRSREWGHGAINEAEVVDQGVCRRRPT